MSISLIFLSKLSQKHLKKCYFGPNMPKFYFNVFKNIHFGTKNVKIGQLCHDLCCQLYFYSRNGGHLENGGHLNFCVANGFLIKYMP